MFGASWLNWAIEHQNWFFGAVGAALIFYMGRGCVSIISRQRRQPTGILPRLVCRIGWYTLFLSYPLVDNSGMGEGAVVDLMDNPLNDEAYDIYIPELQRRGVRVRFNPKL